MRNNECIAMLLAGGQGSRLKKLTENNAKPAVMFGGKYRIIDFSLSNCFNSDIRTVGVLTQYKPLLLHRYIGSGAAWAMDKGSDGIYILPPYMGTEGGKWYNGTAHAVYQNIEFIEMHDPEYVLILSGDHIYQMDYSLMLDFHKEKNSDVTIAVMEVPWEETSRFGIMNTNEERQITEFQEKPEKPINNMASMGIYIFNWQVLKDALIRDSKLENSSNDFGKNIIPMLLNEEKQLYAYNYNGYWRDVGTVDSYYQANMDLLDDHSGIDLSKKELKVFSNNYSSQPHLIGEDTEIRDSLVCDGCMIQGSVNHSVVSHDVVIQRDTQIKDAILLKGSKVNKNTRIYKAIIGEGVEIGENCQIGTPNTTTIQIIDKNVPANTKMTGGDHR